MKWVVRVTFILVAGAACTTVMFVQTLKPSNNGAFLFFCAWLIMPYVIISTVLIKLHFKRDSSVHWHVVAALVSIGGTYFLADLIFWHPDARGAIAVLMTPILQGLAAGLLLPIAFWMVRKIPA